jgi:hypothetical protein
MDTNDQPIGMSQPLDNQPPQQPRKKLNWKGFLIGIIAVVIIEVIAVNALKNDNKQTASAIPPTPAPTATQITTNPTANWKTYTNNKGGYSIKLPSTWNVNISDDRIKTVPENEPALPINEFSSGLLKDNFGKMLHYVSANQIVTTWDNYPKDWFIEETTSSTTVDQHHVLVKKAVWKTNPPTNSGFTGEWQNVTEMVWYIPADNSEYISLYAKWDNTKPEYENIFKQIFSTFKFTN